MSNTETSTRRRRGFGLAITSSWQTRCRSPCGQSKLRLPVDPIGIEQLQNPDLTFLVRHASNPSEVKAYLIDFGPVLFDRVPPQLKRLDRAAYLG